MEGNKGQHDKKIFLNYDNFEWRFYAKSSKPQTNLWKY